MIKEICASVALLIWIPKSKIPTKHFLVQLKLCQYPADSAFGIPRDEQVSNLTIKLFLPGIKFITHFALRILRNY